MSEWKGEMVARSRGFPYHTDLCLNFCFERAVQMACGCVFLQLSEMPPPPNGLNAGSSVCDVFDGNVTACLKGMSTEADDMQYFIENHCGDCGPQCEEIGFVIYRVAVLDSN